MATYRLQLHGGFPFAAAEALLDYLAELGVGDVYLSPVLQARPGSTHGYDVTDPTRASEELGGDAGFRSLTDAAHARGIGVLLDIVPNHLAADEHGPWWRDLLEHGRSSPFSALFDVDWRPPGGLARDRVVLPLLGDHYAVALERGELRLALAGESLVLRYFGRELPLEPSSYGAVLLAPLAGSGPDDAADDALQHATRDLAAAFLALPPHATMDPAAAAARRDMARALRARFAAMLTDMPGFRILLEEAVAKLNGTPGDPSSFDGLDQLVRAQPYLPAYWRIAGEEINYRRFFNIADLVGIRVEDRRVFDSVHGRVLEWLRGGRLDGLRVDHVDGMLDPAGYLRRLRRAVGEDVYIVVEKVLLGTETLPDEWPVAGTTGYDFLSLVSGVLILPEGLAALHEGYEAFTRSRRRFETIEYDKQRQVIRVHFAGELAALRRRLAAVVHGTRAGRDVAARQLGSALVEVTACLAVYRTYTRGGEVGERDRRVVERAVEAARYRNPALDDVAYELLRRVLLLELPPDADEEQRAEWLDFVLRWQQFTGPIMAKGVEDSSLYVFNTLLSLNDVGGDPGAGALEPAEFHRRLGRRAAAWPLSMNASSTHDTKRSEDVRARLHALAELPDEWRDALRRWHDWNDEARGRNTGAPDRNGEVLIYQSLLGAWPLWEEELEGFAERIRDYVLKAAREAKVHTSWVDPDEAYEAELLDFVERVLDPRRGGPFLDDLRSFAGPLQAAGAVISLAQLVLKLAAPGVPDFYQGTELWRFSLVDPDNRRPVDYALRRRLLAELGGPADDPERTRALLARWRDGAVKLWVMREALRLRRRRAELFAEGEYLPLPSVEDGGLARALGFARRRGGEWVVAVVPRGVAVAMGAKLEAGGPWPAELWGGAALALPPDAPGRWRDALTGRTLEAEPGGEGLLLRPGALFDPLPVALLEGGD